MNRGKLALRVGLQIDVMTEQLYSLTVFLRECVSVSLTPMVEMKGEGCASGRIIIIFLTNLRVHLVPLLM